MPKTTKIENWMLVELQLVWIISLVKIGDSRSLLKWYFELPLTDLDTNEDLESWNNWDMSMNWVCDQSYEIFHKTATFCNLENLFSFFHFSVRKWFYILFKIRFDLKLWSRIKL